MVILKITQTNEEVFAIKVSAIQVDGNSTSDISITGYGKDQNESIFWSKLAIDEIIEKLNETKKKLDEKQF